MPYTFTASATSVHSMQDQIDTAAIANDGINYTGDQMTIIGTFSGAQETTINGFVVAAQLDFAREAKFDSVDDNTNELILGGFSHSSKQFPLVLDHRSNYIGIQVFGGFPYKIQNLHHDDVLSVADQAAYDLFIVDGMSRFRYIKDGESDLIVLIRDAISISAVNAIVDSRV